MRNKLRSEEHKPKLSIYQEKDEGLQFIIKWYSIWQENYRLLVILQGRYTLQLILEGTSTCYLRHLATPTVIISITDQWHKKDIDNQQTAEVHEHMVLTWTWISWKLHRHSINAIIEDEQATILIIIETCFLKQSVLRKEWDINEIYGSTIIICTVYDCIPQ